MRKESKMDKITLSVIILIITATLIGLLIYYMLWEAKVKEDLRFMTEDRFRSKHPLVYRALLRRIDKRGGE